MLKQELLNFLKEHRFVPSKKMGQNFLINDAQKNNIVKAANVNGNDCVLEIGPGFGAITHYLAQATTNLALVELDKRLAHYLRDHYPTLTIVNDDILKLDLATFFKTQGWSQVKVVANLPYSISSKIIIKLLRTPTVSSINILVQKEMAQRLFALPNTKNYNAFSVLTQLCADVKIALKLQPQEFYPAPEVDSWFVLINKHQKYTFDFERMDKLLRISFASRRKKLLNNLNLFYPSTKLKALFDDLNWNPNFRAEDLSLDQFMTLYNELEQ